MSKVDFRVRHHRVDFRTRNREIRIHRPRKPPDPGRRPPTDYSTDLVSSQAGDWHFFSDRFFGRFLGFASLIMLGKSTTVDYKPQKKILYFHILVFCCYSLQKYLIY